MVQHGVGADATVATSYVHGAGGAGPHQLTSMLEVVDGGGSTATLFAYDDAGNRVSKTVGTDTTEYAWDVEGELVVAGGEVYSYDASGNRMLRESSAGLTVYVPGGQELLTAGEDVSATRYYSFAGRMVAMRSSGGVGAVTSFVADHQGTLVAAVPNTNWAANAVERVYTDPFGGKRGGSDALPGDRGFLGAVEDATGLALLGARYYDSQVGSFISVDPLLSPGVPAQFNAYVYSGNNPVTWSDASGLMWGGSKFIIPDRPNQTASGSTSGSGVAKGNSSQTAGGLTAAGTLQAGTRNGLIQASKLSYDLLVRWMQSETAQTLYVVGNRNRGLLNDLMGGSLAFLDNDLPILDFGEILAFLGLLRPSREYGESVAAVGLLFDNFQTGGEWDAKVYLQQVGIGSSSSGAVMVGEEGGRQVRSDVFGNVNYGSMMALFGVDEQVAVDASNANLSGTGRSDPVDDHNIRVGYQMVRDFPNGVTSQQYLEFILRNGHPESVANGQR